MTQGEIKTSIQNAADLLREKAYELSSDINREKVKSIYITITVSSDDIPSMDITKTYFVHER